MASNTRSGVRAENAKGLNKKMDYRGKCASHDCRLKTNNDGAIFPSLKNFVVKRHKKTTLEAWFSVIFSPCIQDGILIKVGFDIG